MGSLGVVCLPVLVVWLGLSGPAHARQAPGSIRGSTYDKDFSALLGGVQVSILETGKKTLSTDLGTYVLTEVAPGQYTLVFSKPGFNRQVRTGVLVTTGQLTEVDMWLEGEFIAMDEFVVQDLLASGAGTESFLLELRAFDSSMLDSVGSDLMSRAAAGDAASGLRLVAGASVQDNRAVIRGLPDRYVSSQLNGVRLPSADEDKRAVELDQFPAAVIESLQVSKTFTPDQQGDASGGAVDIRLKGIPDATTFSIKSQLSYNSQVFGQDNFLGYDGGGVSTWGNEDNGKIQPTGANWDGAVGVSSEDAPTDWKFSMSGGGKVDFDESFKIGGFGSLFYERDSSFYDNGISDGLVQQNPGEGLTPEIVSGVPPQPGDPNGDYKTALFDVTRAQQSVQWGGLGTFGFENDGNEVSLTALYTRTAEDTATLAEDTRGKEYYFPGYDPTNPLDPGNQSLQAAPYLRTETLEYSERTQQSLILNGKHTLPTQPFQLGQHVAVQPPIFDWTLSKSFAGLNQPDKRQFGTQWTPATTVGFPPFTFDLPAQQSPYTPAENFNLGNLQRIFKEIEEDSQQVALNLEFPYEADWSSSKGSLKLGLFDDTVERTFRQETFSNVSDFSNFEGEFEDFWSGSFPSEPNHPIQASETDIDYDGQQDITAFYGMADLPLTNRLSMVFGARFESTAIGVTVNPESQVFWFPPGTENPTILSPGDADVDFVQDDVLPAIGLNYRVNDKLSLRASYSQTIARQTFKELTPVVQQEFLGGPIFIGNPELGMSDLRNYDLRADYTPYQGGLYSLSVFHKQMDQPIEYVQREVLFTYTTPVNYPKGQLSGIEAEVRQALGQVWSPLEGLSAGANATFIDSKVELPQDEIDAFSLPEIDAPITEREATAAPEHLYNFYLTYDIPHSGTSLGLFYTVTGDTLVAGPGTKEGNLIPGVYAKEYGTLNLSMTQKFAKGWSLQFQAKNLTNPAIEEVYRSDFIDHDYTKSSYTQGVELSLTLSISL